MPEWVLIVAAIGSPIVALVGIVLGQLHIGSRVQAVKVEINSRMDKLLEITAKSARAEGVIEGKATAEADAKVMRDRVTLDAGLRAEGAEDLLKAQGTPPAEHQA